jgi:integrase
MCPHTHPGMTSPLSVSASSLSNKTAPSTREIAHADQSECSATYDKFTRKLVFANPLDHPTVLTARLSLRRDGAVSKTAKAAMEALRDELNADVDDQLRTFGAGLPSGNMDTIRDFLRDSLVLALPQTAYSAEALKGPLAQYVHWAVFVVGAELDAEIIFDRNLIETYIREELPADIAPGTRRNHRAWITRVAEAVAPDKNPRRPIPLNERAMEVPYDDGDIVALDRWAKGQSTQYTRSNAAILIALGAGAGLTSIEIAQLKTEQVHVADSGLVEIDIVVKGESKRRVVVTSQFERVIAKAVKKRTPEESVFLPQRARTNNAVISAFVGRTSRSPGTPTVTVRRLRNTWFVTQMTNRVDVLTLMEAAGLQSLETISRLAHYVPRPTAADRDAQLRGAK